MAIWKQLVLCLVLVGAALGGWIAYRSPEMIGWQRAPSETATSPRPNAGRGDRIPGLVGRGGSVNVITAPVEVDPGGETLRALGTAKAVRSVTLFPEVTGVVEEVLFTPGQPVAEGDVLVRLDDAEQQVALDRAKVTLAQANQALERAQTLAKSKNVTIAALQEAELAAQLAEIEQRAATIALERMSVTAPFNGATGLSDISIGDLVTSTTAITTLDDQATMRVAFEAPERWAMRIVAGQEIAASAQAAPGSNFPGRIVGIDNRVDETTRTIRVEADLVNVDGVLKTGTAVSVDLRFDSEEQLVVPTLSVQWDRRGSYVWKVADGAVTRSAVDILRRESGVVVVQGDVAAGDKVVAEGIQRLREGAKVTEVNLPDPSSAEEAVKRDEAPPSVSARQSDERRS